MNDVKTLIATAQWDALRTNFSPLQLASSLSFEEGVRIASKIVQSLDYRNEKFEEFLNYPIDLLLILKEQNPAKWDADWKLCTYLYNLCLLAYRYEEGYLAVKHAYEINPNPPPMLALFYAYSYENEPGLPTISWEEAEKLAKFAAEKENSCEPAGFLANLYRSVQNEQLADYWHQKAVEAREEGRYSTPITPDLLA